MSCGQVRGTGRRGRSSRLASGVLRHAGRSRGHREGRADGSSRRPAATDEMRGPDHAAGHRERHHDSDPHREWKDRATARRRRAGRRPAAADAEPPRSFRRRRRPRRERARAEPGHGGTSAATTATRTTITRRAAGVAATRVGAGRRGRLDHGRLESDRRGPHLCDRPEERRRGRNTGTSAKHPRTATRGSSRSRPGS